MSYIDYEWETCSYNEQCVSYSKIMFARKWLLNTVQECCLTRVTLRGRAGARLKRMAALSTWSSHCDGRLMLTNCWIACVGAYRQRVSMVQMNEYGCRLQKRSTLSKNWGTAILIYIRVHLVGNVYDSNITLCTFALCNH